MSLTDYSEAYRPFHYPYFVEKAEESERMHWTKEEVPLTDDISDWKSGKLTEGEKEFYTQILRMFTQSDTNVGGYYLDVLIPHIKNNEARMALVSNANREGEHQRAYANVNDTLNLPEGDYLAFKSYKEMADKHEFMLDADPSTPKGLALAIAKGVFNEGVSLFASFVMLLNGQRYGKMKGMCKIVEWSIKDESLHVEVLAYLFKQFCKENPEIVDDRFKREIYSMSRRAVELEDAFVDLAYGTTSIEGLRAEDVKQYIRFITDRRLVQLGLKENWGIDKNPLPWLDWILNAADHTNFFEAKVAEYEVGGLQGDWGYPESTPLEASQKPSGIATESPVKGVEAPLDPPRYTSPGSPSQVFYVYWKDGCGWCEKAKELLHRESKCYLPLDMSDDDQRHMFYDLHDLEGDQRTMPQVFLGGTRIGGYVELKEFLGV